MLIEIIALGIALAITLVLYIDYLDESNLRSKLRSELPETSYAEIESISRETGKEYGTTYHVKTRKRDGSTKKVDVKCKNGSMYRGQSISV